jgi:hypothetical protein
MTIGKLNSTIVELRILQSFSHIESRVGELSTTLLSLNAEVVKQNSYGVIFRNPAVQTVGINTLIGLGAGVIASVIATSIVENQKKTIGDTKLENVPDDDKRHYLDDMSNISIMKINEFNSNMSNLTMFQGFIHSYILNDINSYNISSNTLLIQNYINSN